MMLKILIFSAIASGLGIAFIFVRRLIEVRKMSEDELIKRLRETEPIFYNFHSGLIDFFSEIWKEKISPVFYRGLERVVIVLQKVLKKIEVYLEKFNNYIYGKTHPKNSNGGSEYWNHINKYKEEIRKENRPLT